tara:strand:+ start:43 stop:414 length:372 start_codon:yes stop_codon:yes gene_type:complete
MAITNKEILEEIEFLKKKMPNGEFALLKKSVEDLNSGQESLKSSIRNLKQQLLDPDNGVVVRVNRNSDFRKESEQRGPLCQQSFNNMEDSVQDIISWKDNVTKALWILFTGLVGLVIKTVLGY